MAERGIDMEISKELVEYNEYKRMLNQHPEDASIWQKCQITAVKFPTSDSCRIFFKNF